MRDNILDQVGLRFAAVALVIILSSGVSYAAPSSGAITNDACSIALSLKDWRLITAIGLTLSSVFVAVLYMYGSVLESSFKAKARNEFYQLAVTAVIALMFVSIVQFMCGSAIPDMLGFNDQRAYDVATSYLKDLITYTKQTFYSVFTFTTFIGTASSVTVGGGTSTRSVAGMFSSMSYLNEAIGALFALVLGSYMMSLMQFQLLGYVQIISLTVFLPAGIVLRSIFFTRKFGGALIGAAIALYIGLPFLLMINKVMVDPFFNAQDVAATCVIDGDCYSHNCNTTSGTCIAMLPAGSACKSGFQCATGYCTNSKCDSCGGFNEAPENKLCCQSFVWSEGVKRCVAAKPNGEKCVSDSECVSWFCDSKGLVGEGTRERCASPLASGTCNDDGDCFGRTCAGVAPNKECVDTIRTKQDQLLILSIAASADKIGLSSQVIDSIAISGPMTYTSMEGLDTRMLAQPTEKGFIEKMFDRFVGSIIAGMFLPLLNLMLISRAVKDLSSFFGSELDIASIWKVI